MNTEQRVLAMLNKVQKVRLSKKENLGAIDEVIKREKDNLQSLIDSMVSVTRVLEAGIEVYTQETADATSRLSDAIRETESEFSNLQNEAFVIQNDLDSLGQADNSLNDVIDYFDELLSNADSKI